MVQDFSGYLEKASDSKLEVHSDFHPVQVLLDQMNRVATELREPGRRRSQLHRILNESAQTLLTVPEFAVCRSGQMKRNLLWGALETLTGQPLTRNSGDQVAITTFETIEHQIEKVFPSRTSSNAKIKSVDTPSPSLWIVSGIPGSGKSTWISAFIATATAPIVIVSTDDLRAELLGDATEQGANRKIFKIAHSRVRFALRAGKSVVFDATNLLKAHRSPVWRIGRACGARSIAVVLATPLSEALRRNQARSRQVPEVVIARFFLQWQRPSLSEADERWVVET